MKKEKGFTLIELLAVIVILGIITVIAVPKILDIINKSRNSAVNSSLKLVKDAIKTQIASSDLTGPVFTKETDGCYVFNFDDQTTGNSKELSTFRDGSKSNGSENATARNLAEFISTSLSNGGYYIARFEASKTKTTSKIYSKYNQKVLTDKPQPEAASLAREMYGEVKENNELIYASDLVNSYAWDTAIIFIQTYSTEEKASTYASQNKSTSFANTGINNDKYCNIWDMSGNVEEWTTEDCDNPIHQNSTWFNVSYRGGKYDSSKNDVYAYTSRGSFGPDSFGTLKVSCGFRISLIVGTAK